MDAEPDGIWKAMGAVVGGAVGASAGLAGGAAVASLLVPGGGTVFAIGLGAAAALGLGGAAAGAKAGDVTEHALDVGVPKDEVQFYHDLLRQGRSLVMANVDPRNKPQLHGPCSSSRVAKTWTEPARSWEKRHKQAPRFNFRPESRIAFRLAGPRSVVLAAPAENLQTTCWL